MALTGGRKVNFIEYIFWVCIILSLWTYVLYPIFLYILVRNSELYKKPDALEEWPEVTLLIVAHNEETVIKEKLENALALDYQQNQLKIMVTSDFSSDGTVSIVQQFADRGVVLYETKQRKGKTNAQNEACEFIDSEIIAFSDANSLWQKDALKQLVTNFEDEKVGYVSGALKYINTQTNNTSASEGIYWKYELFLRKNESRLKSITAGNGAIYAIRQSLYEPIDILYCHDFEYPSLFVKNGHKAIFDDEAIALEKAGETTSDEYKRKVRMFSRTWHKILRNPWIFNPFKMGSLYSIFMFSHRLLRYSIGIFQLLILILNIALLGSGTIYTVIMGIQIFYYICSAIGYYNRKLKIFYIFYYLNVFHTATLVGFIKAITNNVKPFWASAATSR